MDTQTPAQGISIDNEYDEAKVFNVECECTADDHAVKMWIELDRDAPYVTVTFYADFWTPVSGWWQRVKIAWNVMVHGVHRQEHDLMLRKQAALNFASAITQSVKELEKSHDPRGN